MDDTVAPPVYMVYAAGQGRLLHVFQVKYKNSAPEGNRKLVLERSISGPGRVSPLAIRD